MLRRAGLGEVRAGGDATAGDHGSSWRKPPAAPQVARSEESGCVLLSIHTEWAVMFLFSPDLGWRDIMLDDKMLCSSEVVMSSIE